MSDCSSVEALLNLEAQPSPRKRAFSVVDAVYRSSGGCDGGERKRQRALSLGSWETKTPMQSLASLAGLSDEEMLAATSLALVGEVGSAGSSTTSGSPQNSSPQVASPPSAVTAAAAAAALSTVAAAAALTDSQFFALPPMPAAKRSRAATLPCLLGSLGSVGSSSSGSGSGNRRTTDASNLAEPFGEAAPSGRGCRSRSGSFQATMRELVGGTGSRPRSGSGSWVGRSRAETIACDGDEDGRPVNVKMIGIYTLEERRKRIERFLEKRKQRVWVKKVQYAVRKDFAETRVRVKGRFVGKEA